MSLEPAPPSRDRTASWRDLVRTLAVVVVLSNAIALLLLLVDSDDSPAYCFTDSNVVGLCTFGLMNLLRIASRGRIGRPLASLIAVPVALVAGFQAGDLVGPAPVLSRFLHDPWHEWRPLAAAVILSIGGVIFVMRHRAASEHRAGLEAQRRQAAEARQGEALARLAMLQAQIEPHFLFNTLANVQSMIEREPRTAARMLDHLNRYLRSSLGRTRAPSSTCREELELIEALLAIAEIRLGGRLRYTLDLPQELRRARLPPLLLQPLVENALKHGIEPAVGGGEVAVECAKQNGELLLRVRDTGLGFPEGAPPGVGLSNVRARLTSLYGPDGHLALYRNEPRGTIAEIRLPLLLE
jgi:signal transduction histidine kinase